MFMPMRTHCMHICRYVTAVCMIAHAHTHTSPWSSLSGRLNKEIFQLKSVYFILSSMPCRHLTSMPPPPHFPPPYPSFALVVLFQMRFLFLVLHVCLGGGNFDMWGICKARFAKGLSLGKIRGHSYVLQSDNPICKLLWRWVFISHTSHLVHMYHAQNYCKLDNAMNYKVLEKSIGLDPKGINSFQRRERSP